VAQFVTWSHVDKPPVAYHVPLAVFVAGAEAYPGFVQSEASNTGK
jgi:hypothetical protein